MKQLFTICLLLSVITLRAQSYNNEWIDFSKTYYKFKVGSTGLYRIPQGVLAAAGLGGVPAQNFQLFRNGEEVPVYTSVASGVLGVNDYIEFWAFNNDGKADKALYRLPAYQHTDKVSLQTDTAVYFLTVNTATNFHFSNVVNNVAGNVLPVEPYFMYTAGTYFRTQINPGYAKIIGEYIFSSAYDVGEFFSSDFSRPGGPVQDQKEDLYPYLSGPDATLKYGAAGCTDTTRSIRVSLNNSLLRDVELDSFNDVVDVAPVPISLLSSGVANISFANNTHQTIAPYNDRLVVSFSELTYPRQFNFNGQSNFYFELAAKPAGYFLQISNFNVGSALPVLYDLVSGERYRAVISGGFISFALTGSSQPRKLVLLSEDASNINTVTSLSSKTFINFKDPAAQGNYLIITHPSLYVGSSGNNPIQDYANYRASSSGGSFKVQIVDINELVDQFAFGIKKHPSSIKNFLRFARANFATKPAYAFLIGHSVAYNDYRANEYDPMSEQLNLIPTFGVPASDIKLATDDGYSNIPLTPIGRLSVINGSEVEVYLQKVKEYEQTQQTSPNTLAGREWMKNVIHVTGAAEASLGYILCNYMTGYKATISDTLIGANVTLFCKSSAAEVETIASSQLADLFSTGISMINYFGHSSSSTLAYNLDDPSIYNNQGKYPVMYVNGCYAGNFFTFDPARLQNGKTLSETYVLAKEKGSIAFVASTHYGIVNYLNLLILNLYNLICSADYGKPIGVIQEDVVKKLMTIAPNDHYARLTAEQMTLHGDPALTLNSSVLPDYVAEASQLKVTPQFVSVADSKFTVNIRLVNIGKAVPDSITITVQRRYPNGSVTTEYSKRIPGIRYDYNFQLQLPVVATRDKGQNTITVTVDADNNVAEVSESNNTASVGVFIYEDELRPVFPYQYAIVNNPSQKLYASTANPIAPSTQYIMEMDTTDLFNSPAKISKTLVSVGGVLEFDPGGSFRDSTVYYWRTSIVPGEKGQFHWNESSFIYLSNSSEGFNQSHYFQQVNSTGAGVQLNNDRLWHYSLQDNNLYITQTVYTGTQQSADFAVSVNNSTYIESACVGFSLVFNVFDGNTFKPWKNVDASGNSLYLSGSASASCGPSANWNFEFPYTDAGNRYKMMRFIDSIPTGDYVVVRNITNSSPPPNTFAPDWEKDTALYGSNNSLYHKLVAAGFTKLDSFYVNRSFVFVFKKNDPSFTPQQQVSAGIYDKVLMSVTCPTPNLRGDITSPAFGPAKQWQMLHWRGSSLESPSTDSIGLDVIGVDNQGTQVLLATLPASLQDFNIGNIVNAQQYPYVQLKLHTADSVHVTPYQLRYWRLNYVPVPEGALAPNIFYTGKDTVELGEHIPFGIAFKNVSKVDFDSVLVNMTITDKNNVAHAIALPRKKPLIVGDTVKVTYDIDTRAFPGLNTIYLDVNPNNDQPEEYHFNNFLYKTFYAGADSIKPILDVTFDNVHILNQDIVSAKPHIQIKLKDDSKSLLLNDTSLISVQVRYPDGSLHPYHFNSDTLRFTPATNGADNAATVDFTPAFTKQYSADGDNYELIVTGKDKSGNPTGTVQYRVAFKIINKAMISNMLNYPNPFTTSTAFVFTITGSEVPQNIKIQILTITGKIVREITKDELGPLHVGRNITEFKWDGTDMYGQRLGNGVYLYHVVTNLNGKSLDKYKAEGDNTDTYFTKGYGKMYLMR